MTHEAIDTMTKAAMIEELEVRREYYKKGENKAQLASRLETARRVSARKANEAAIKVSHKAHQERRAAARADLDAWIKASRYGSEGCAAGDENDGALADIARNCLKAKERATGTLEDFKAALVNAANAAGQLHVLERANAVAVAVAEGQVADDMLEMVAAGWAFEEFASHFMRFAMDHAGSTDHQRRLQARAVKQLFGWNDHLAFDLMGTPGITRA